MQSDTTPFTFRKVSDADADELQRLKGEWRKTLVIPQDAMWETFMDASTHWGIWSNGDHENGDGNGNEAVLIGYACIDEVGRLLQFFVAPQWMDEGPTMLSRFLADNGGICVAMVGTNNPVFHSCAIRHQRSAAVDTLFFMDCADVPVSSTAPPPPRGVGGGEAVLSVATEKDLERLVSFCHSNMGGPVGWLNVYLSDLIAKGELFVLHYEADGKVVLGTCEVRKSSSQPTVAELGMVVSKDHRKQGVGTYLLGRAKGIAMDWNRTPICSCVLDNVGSLRCIHKNGFRSVHQLLKMEF